MSEQICTAFVELSRYTNLAGGSANGVNRKQRSRDRPSAMRRYWSFRRAPAADLNRPRTAHRPLRSRSGRNALCGGFRIADAIDSSHAFRTWQIQKIGRPGRPLKFRTKRSTRRGETRRSGTSLKRHHKVRFYYEIGCCFSGAAWEDLSIGIEHTRNGSALPSSPTSAGSGTPSTRCVF
jgi:hypothetical protein